MSMFGGQPGSWGFSSKKNPKWNRQGRADCMLVLAGMCPEAKAALREMKRRLGKPPRDLVYSCMKD